MSRDTLTSLDIATGVVLPSGRGDRHARPVHDRPSSGACHSPRDAVERAILPALLRPPCLVSFSGGRDSAAVLAVATSLARREGLPTPIPVTNVFPSLGDADETSWQEVLVRHLGLPEWIRIEHNDELDLIGPYAQRVLETHGLVWPANLHFHLPLLDAAHGGSMLTGVGGDELYFAARRLRPAVLFSRTARPRPRDVLTLGFALSPRRVRKAVMARRAPVEAPWLRDAARRRITALLAAEAAAEPRRLNKRLTWWQTLRYLRVGVASLELLAHDTGTLIVNPLLSPRLWRAVAASAPQIGFASRTDGVQHLFGDLLPPEIIRRNSKGNFDRVFWTERSRVFARAWDGTGVPDQWVDASELASHWAGARPTVPSSILLQAAFLASAGQRVEQEPERILH